MHEHSRSMRALLRRLFRAYQDFVSPTRYQVRQFVRSQLRGVRARTCLDLAAGISPYRSDIERATGSEIFISADLYPTDRTTLVCDARRLPFGDGRIDLVLDGGPCVGAGATTVDITEPYWRVIREGAVPERDIAECLKPR